MNKIVLCPGKIPIRNKTQPWYAPIGDYPSNYVICECCFKHYGKLLHPICFKIVYGEKYHCWCEFRTFDKSSIKINNVRVSVINPENYFRYRITKKNNEIIFNIPEDGKYQIIVENMDHKSDSKISVDVVNYDDIEVRYYDKKYPQYLIIDNDDYIVYNNLSKIEQHIDFVIKEWIKSTDPYMKSHYIRRDNKSYYSITLLFNNNEDKIINSIIEINKNLSDNNGKVVLIEDFMDSL
ncbi:hypothetical protein Indivirus_1_79 [Indivirus ILV1]|uniref:Uncharacterized protein n=1 Tax=Indivirus ILV1 TaxID=1977633 RepID=A0A1V0SCL7_9VIRU|nr:hypothetical protein Indivirus_1_79 [Indivirus ILV1]